MTAQAAHGTASGPQTQRSKQDTVDGLRIFNKKGRAAPNWAAETAERRTKAVLQL